MTVKSAVFKIYHLTCFSQFFQLRNSTCSAISYWRVAMARFNFLKSIKEGGGVLRTNPYQTKIW